MSSNEPVNLMLVAHSEVDVSAFRSKYFPIIDTDISSAMGLTLAPSDIIVGGSNIKIHLFEISGDSFFKSVRGTYYKNVSRILFLVDASIKRSLDVISTYLDEIMEFVGKLIPFDILLINLHKSSMGNQESLSELQVKEYVNALEPRTSEYGFQSIVYSIDTLSTNKLDYLFEQIIKSVLSFGKHKETETSVSETTTVFGLVEAPKTEWPTKLEPEINPVVETDTGAHLSEDEKYVEEFISKLRSTLDAEDVADIADEWRQRDDFPRQATHPLGRIVRNLRVELRSGPLNMEAVNRYVDEIEMVIREGMQKK